MKNIFLESKWIVYIFYYFTKNFGGLMICSSASGNSTVYTKLMKDGLL